MAKSKKLVAKVDAGTEAVRGRGRPVVYTGALADRIIEVIREKGLTKAREFLKKEGIQVAPGQKKKKVEISMPTLGKLAKGAGITLSRGRPKVA